MIKIFMIFRRMPQAIKPTQTFGGDIFFSWLGYCNSYSIWILDRISLFEAFFEFPWAIQTQIISWI